MAIKRKEPKQFTIDLDGPDGNAFVIMGRVQNLMRQLGYSKAKIEDTMGLMESSDYVNLLRVADKVIGDHVTFETENEEYLNALT